MSKPARHTTKHRQEAITPEFLRQRLKLASLDAKNRFIEKYIEADDFLKTKGVELSRVREHSTKLIGAGALASTLLLSTPIKPIDTTKYLEKPNHTLSQKPATYQLAAARKASDVLLQTLNQVLPDTTRPLSRDEEKFLEKLFENVIGIKSRATLEGEHLNTTYGRIGAEQHLRRFPGDDVANHAPEKGEYGYGRSREILKEGIAPGLGAWGYFAPSKERLTQNLVETEKWYAVVQTLYLPDWNSRTRYLRDWYKYRKVLIVNTLNGKAVVASIADSGPAAWTGKHYGGSPEVMDYLGGPRYKKGPVVLFFVDDPDNRVKLGPIEYDKGNFPIYEL